eukprot:13212784-Heterocapsa_arctica.AAC.1
MVDYNESFNDLEVMRGRLRSSRSGVTAQLETAGEQEELPRPCSKAAEQLREEGVMQQSAREVAGHHGRAQMGTPC